MKLTTINALHTKTIFWSIIAIIAVICISICLISNPNQKVNIDTLKNKPAEVSSRVVNESKFIGETSFQIIDNVEYYTDVNYANKFLSYKTPSVGDSSKVGGIISLLKFPSKINYNSFRLFTKVEPYEITINLKTDTKTKAYYRDSENQSEVQSVFRHNAIILLSLIDNVDKINYTLDDDLIEYTIQYSRADADKILGQDVRKFTKSEIEFSKLLRALTPNMSIKGGSCSQEDSSLNLSEMQAKKILDIIERGKLVDPNQQENRNPQGGYSIEFSPPIQTGTKKTYWFNAYFFSESENESFKNQYEYSTKGDSAYISSLYELFVTDEYTPPILSVFLVNHTSISSDNIGAEMPLVIYADEEKAIINFQNFIFEYDFNRSTINNGIDLHKTFGNEIKQETNIVASKDGESIYVFDSCVPNGEKFTIYTCSMQRSEIYNNLAIKKPNDCCQIEELNIDSKAYTDLVKHDYLISSYFSRINQNSIAFMRSKSWDIKDLEICIYDNNTKSKKFFPLWKEFDEPYVDLTATNYDIDIPDKYQGKNKIKPSLSVNQWNSINDKQYTRRCEQNYYNFTYFDKSNNSPDKSPQVVFDGTVLDLSFYKNPPDEIVVNRKVNGVSSFVSNSRRFVLEQNDNEIEHYTINCTWNNGDSMTVNFAVKYMEQLRKSQ